MKSRPLRAVLALAAVCGLSACATKPPATDQAALQEYQQNNDPYEPANRVGYAIDDGLETYILAPVTRAYVWAVPNAVRQPVHNFIQNLTTPVLFINDVLQTKPRRAGTTLVRFVVNSTAGVGGLFDVAAKIGYPYHANDFGITMALWGVPEGPFLFLPVLGPSNPRDATGYGVDTAMQPLTYFPSGHYLNAARGGLLAVTAVDTYSRIAPEINSVKKTALDPYATFRSLYRQNRENTIDKDRSDDPETVPNWYAK